MARIEENSVSGWWEWIPGGRSNESLNKKLKATVKGLSRPDLLNMESLREEEVFQDRSK